MACPATSPTTSLLQHLSLVLLTATCTQNSSPFYSLSSLLDDFDYFSYLMSAGLPTAQYVNDIHVQARRSDPASKQSHVFIIISQCISLTLAPLRLNAHR